MSTMKKIFLSLFLLVAMSNIKAQSFADLSYSIGFPSGDFSDYICDTSFRGFSFGFGGYVKPNISLAINLGWNVFYQEKGYDTYTNGTASLTGKQYRTNNSVPMMGNINYHFKPNEKINPYVGLGAGVVYNRLNTDMYVYTVEEDAWNFALQPEIGVAYKLNSEVAMTLAGKYYYCFEGGDIDFPVSYFALNIGFSFLHK